MATLVRRLFPLATALTPNLPEAQALTGLATEDRAVLAERLAARGAQAVLITGGHGREPAAGRRRPAGRGHRGRRGGARAR